MTLASSNTSAVPTKTLRCVFRARPPLQTDMRLQECGNSRSQRRHYFSDEPRVFYEQRQFEPLQAGQQRRRPPERRALGPRWQGAIGTGARIAEAHRRDRDLTNVVKRVAIDPHPFAQAIAARIVERDARFVHRAPVCLPEPRSATSPALPNPHSWNDLNGRRHSGMVLTMDCVSRSDAQLRARVREGADLDTDRARRLGTAAAAPAGDARPDPSPRAVRAP